MTTPMNTAANHENFNEGFIFYHAFDQTIDSMLTEALQKNACIR